MELRPIVLTGKVVRLEPLSEVHIESLAEAGGDPDIWTFMRYGVCDTPEKMSLLIGDLLSLQAKGTDLPFAVIHLESGRAIGMTRYMDIQPANRALEIGGTWYAPAFQRTAVNSECKYLLLSYAFEVQKVVRVQFKADLRNKRSLRAIERIGAVREGVLRNHMILPDGTIRSSVYYSILADEWPPIKLRLEDRLGLAVG